MAAAVIAVGSAVAGSAAATAAGFTIGSIGYAVTSAVVGMAVSHVASGIMGLNDTPDQPQQQAMDNRASGVMLNTDSTTWHLPVFYGTGYAGGRRRLLGTSGENNKYCHVILDLCDGEIDAIEEIYLNDIPITDARFDGVVEYSVHLGADDQAADSALVNRLDWWTTAHRNRGVGYIYFRFEWAQEVWGGSIPRITVKWKGRKVYDLRTGQTVWSDNPALCNYDYLTNMRYGRGIPASRIDEAAIIAAANYCDEMIAKGGTSAKRYTCNGIITGQQGHMANMRELLSSCRGVLLDGGLYTLAIDRPTVATFDFNEDNIVGGWSIGGGSMGTTWNRVRAEYVSFEMRGKSDIATADSADLRTQQDQGKVRETKNRLPFTNDQPTAQQIATIDLNQSRQALTAKFRSTIAGQQCRVFDVVRVTHPSPGWDSKKFRIMDMEPQPDDEVLITVREYADASYDFGTIPLHDTAPNTTLPDPFRAEPPTNLTLNSGTAHLMLAKSGEVISRVFASWDGAADAYVREYEVQWRTDSDPSGEWRTAVVSSRAEIYLYPVVDSALVDVRVRSVNGLGVRSGWAEVVDHVVLGKTVPPSNVTGFRIDRDRLSWNPVGDADLAGYLIRYRPGQNDEWDDASPLHEGVVTNNPYKLPIELYNAVTLLIKAVDTTGNESVLSAAIYTDLGDPVVGNVVEEINLLSDGAVAADPDGGGDYLPLTHIASFRPSAAAVGHDLRLLQEIQGEGVTVEYGLHDAPLWTGWDEPLWTDWNNPLWTEPNWAAFPGALIASRDLYWLRVTIAAGATQGAINDLRVQIDAPDIEELINDFTVPAGGGQLPVTKDYFAIKHINLTLQAGIGGAIAALIVDYAPDGPTVKLLDSDGLPASGTVDAFVQGY